MSLWSINETWRQFILFWFVTNHPIQIKFYDFFAKYRGRILEPFLLVFEKPIYIVSPLLNPKD
jgi:hypothetical protein